MRRLYAAMVWALCLAMAPLVLAGFFFQPAYIPFGIVVFLFFRYGWPRLSRKTRLRSFRSAVFMTEAVIVLLTLIYYTSDHREQDCRFPLDDRVVPLLTYRQCAGMPGKSAGRCMDATADPYGLAMYGDELLAACGRNDTTLVRLDPDRPGRYRAEDLGFGNIQQITVLPDVGHALMPMWKKNRILVYDLKNSKSLEYLTTGVSKLIGAEKYKGDTYVISESPYLYRVTPGDYKVEEHRLPYKHYNLYDILADTRRGNMFFTDWVWGIVYKFDIENMKPGGNRFLWGVATGLALDEDRCQLFVSHGIPGRIEVLDCETLSMVRSIRVGFGGHELALSRDGERIYLVRYFGGKFTEIDRRTGEVLDELQVGGQTRSLFYWKEKNRLFLASRCGIFEIKL